MTLFEEAICFAVKAHSGMTRKRESTPYILHPMEVAAIVGTMTSDEEVLAAAVLHDTVEDAGATLEQIESLFGPRVTALVASETENKYPELPREETWRLRKEEALRVLETATDPGVKVLWLGDKLSNMRSFYRAWEIGGNSIWESFHQKDPAQQAWYYRSVEKLLSEFKHYEAWQELHVFVDMVFKGI